jgi:hypothetical protein
MACLTFRKAATSLADHSRYPTAPIWTGLGGSNIPAAINFGKVTWWIHTRLAASAVVSLPSEESAETLRQMAWDIAMAGA